MDNPSAPIGAETVLIGAGIPVLLVKPGESKWVEAILQYITADPYVVRLVFPITGREPVIWLLDREDLTNGLDGPTGVGVRIWPWRELGDYVALEFIMAKACVTIAIDRRTIARFLGRTHEAVPRGDENKFQKVGDWIDRIFADDSL